MPKRQPVEVHDLDDLYGGGPLTWAQSRASLVEALPRPETACFLGTLRPDGSPHSAGVGALWHDGDLFFTSGRRTRKARNLARDPRCTLSVRAPGVDLVFEGEARRVTEPEVLEPVAAGYRDGGWPARVEGEALTAPFSAQSAGPPPWYVYRLSFHTVFGVATAEPFGATRWRF
jgi:Pyridoxamine 5'-phosphate oxidase